MSESNNQLEWVDDKEGTYYANGAGGFKYEWMAGILYVFQGDILIFCIECGTMEHAEDCNKAILKACEEARKDGFALGVKMTAQAVRDIYDGTDLTRLIPKEEGYDRPIIGKGISPAGEEGDGF